MLSAPLEFATHYICWRICVTSCVFAPFRQVFSGSNEGSTCANFASWQYNIFKNIRPSKDYSKRTASATEAGLKVMPGSWPTVIVLLLSASLLGTISFHLHFIYIYWDCTSTAKAGGLNGLGQLKVDIFTFIIDISIYLMLLGKYYIQ